MKPPDGKSGTLYVVRIETALSHSPAIEEGLAAAGLSLATTEYFDKQKVLFEDYFDNRAGAAAQKKRLAGILAGIAGGKPFSIAVRRIRRRDWSESWKAHFHLQRVSPRIVVKPSWEKFRPGRGDIVVEVDPGMSFGTGQHGTTRACLRLMDRLAGKLPGISFLDAGCGSGILSIAAAHLGYRPVVGFDNDPVAVHTAKANAHKNGVRGRIRFIKQGLETAVFPETFDVVAANLLSSVIMQYAARLAALVTPGGHIILSGILSSEYARVRDTFRNMGFRERHHLSDHGWTSGAFSRQLAG